MWSPSLVTPTFKYFYTDISAISVTFRNSDFYWPVSNHKKSYMDSLTPLLGFCMVFLLCWFCLIAWNMEKGIAKLEKIAMGLDTGVLEDIQVLEQEDNLTSDTLWPAMGNR